MTKYEPLKAFLARSDASEIAMQFADIERVIGAPLPPVAFRHRAWWSNNPTNNVITRAWLDAGYRTERVDMVARRLVFRRPLAGLPEGVGPNVKAGGVLEALRRTLGGTVRLAPGVDLTAPTGDQWDAERQ